MMKFLLLSAMLLSTFGQGCLSAPHRGHSTSTPPSIYITGYSSSSLPLFSPSSCSSLSLTSNSTLPSDGFSWFTYGPGSSPLLLGMDEIANTISTFSISSSDGTLSDPISTIDVASVGPAHILVPRASCTKQGQALVFVANYGSGNVTAFSFDPEGGKIDGEALFTDVLRNYEVKGGPREGQNVSRPHEIAQHPTLDVLYVPDLGNDQIHQYRLEEDGNSSTGCKLVDFGSVDITPGAGPRHLAFNPKFPATVYLIGELDNHLYTLSSDSTTGLLTLSSSPPTDLLPSSATPTPEGKTGPFHAAEIAVSPDGRFVYASNRNTTEGAQADFAAGKTKGDTIAVLGVDEEGQVKEKVQQAETGGVNPRGFVLSEDGEWLAVANQDSANLRVLRRSGEEGTLQKWAKTGEGLQGTQPAAVVFKK